MAYDLHGSWDNVTGHHTALVGPPGDNLTVSYAVQYWIDKVKGLKLRVFLCYEENENVNFGRDLIRFEQLFRPNRLGFIGTR